MAESGETMIGVVDGTLFKFGVFRFACGAIDTGRLGYKGPVNRFDYQLIIFFNFLLLQYRTFWPCCCCLTLPRPPARGEAFRSRPKHEIARIVSAFDTNSTGCSNVVCYQANVSSQ